MSELMKTEKQNPEHECLIDPNNYKTEQIIAPEGSFYWALIQLRLENKVRRRDWSGKEQLNFVPRRMDTEGNYDYLSHIDKRNKHGNWASWQPVQEDLLACDWVLIKESDPKLESAMLIFDLVSEESNIKSERYWGYKNKNGNYERQQPPFGTLNVIQNNTEIDIISSFYFISGKDTPFIYFRISTNEFGVNYYNVGSLVRKNLHIIIDNITYNLGTPTGQHNTDPTGYSVYYDSAKRPAVDELAKVLQQTGEAKRFYCDWN
ncbi:DUF2829 domain-containing protein [Xenorhabdus sp. Reich]|uniref:DUF2829 domain-containing protein n=1 Tax=Xenorhabdus littoralis TaxID=2582835 RepID=A0ABU4SR44_9GAMM|nr:DUF2829 domain-containing protein [Xenorhabdus sp. Reich]MDX8001138.1 DUF2829 domain-containing protein [Xenorhabdus sp. Reich]